MHTTGIEILLSRDFTIGSGGIRQQHRRVAPALPFIADRVDDMHPEEYKRPEELAPRIVTLRVVCTK